MSAQLDLSLLLDVIGMSDDGQNSIITIPATVLRSANRKLCTPFTARECSSPACGREVSRTICWKFLNDTNPSSLQEAHRYWRLQCGMSEADIATEWPKMNEKIVQLQTQYYGAPTDDEEFRRMTPTVEL